MRFPPRALAAAAAVLLVAGGLFLPGLGGWPLLDPDEARHAEVAREMAVAPGVRRLFLPTLGLEPYREKPAGYYWLVALAYRVAGVDEAAARSVSAAAALATVVAVFAWAVPREGVGGALGAALVLATAVGWLGFARYANLDMTLTAFVVAGVLAGLAWLDRPSPRGRPLAPYVAAGLATLVKGPVGAVLVAGPLALAALTRRPRPRFAEVGLGRGVVVTAAIAAALYVPVGLLDRSYLTAFAATNLRRFAAGARHEAPVYYYLVWLPILFLPWTLLAAPAVVRAARDPVRRPLVLWAAFVPAVLTLARGKLASYALSALVPLALVAGPELVRAARTGPPPADRGLFRAAGWLVTVVLGAAAVAAALAGLVVDVSALGRGLLAAGALAWAGATAWITVGRRPALVPVALLGAVLTLVPLAVRFIAPAVGALYSDRDAARLIRDGGSAPVIAFSAQAPSLLFYLGTPPIWTEDRTLVRDLFAADDPVFLVTGRRHFAEVEGLLGARAHRWHGTRRRRLYANRPPPAANGSR